VLKIIIKKSSGALFSELLGSTVFIQPGAAGTRGAPGAALHRKVGTGAVGTLGTLGAALSRELGTGATGTRGAPGAALHREAGATPGAASSRSIIGCFW
jgi:hypothetical protein